MINAEIFPRREILFRPQKLRKAISQRAALKRNYLLAQPPVSQILTNALVSSSKSTLGQKNWYRNPDCWSALRAWSIFFLGNPLKSNRILTVLLGLNLNPWDGRCRADSLSDKKIDLLLAGIIERKNKCLLASVPLPRLKTALKTSLPKQTSECWFSL